jgi:hypothetical protein
LTIWLKRWMLPLHEAKHIKNFTTYPVAALNWVRGRLL